MNPIGSRMWRPAKVTVIVGEPIDFSRFEGMGGNRFVERAVTDEVMYKLMKLSGQEYVDIYAASLKNPKPVKAEESPSDETHQLEESDEAAAPLAAVVDPDAEQTDGPHVPDTRAS